MDQTSDDILDPSQLSFAGDFDAQVMEILTRVRLTRTEVENLQCLLDDVHSAMKCIFPGCQVYPFGSIVTGLGIKTSDIDCYICLPSHIRQYRGNIVNHAKKQLAREPTKFGNLFAITGAKVPIVKFVHHPTGFNCDINFSSLSGVKNSKLIAFLLNLDQRALALAIIIKYWSKVYNFTGTNRMPNYALTMMVIFYLQTKSILPSVAEIQRQEKQQLVDNWDTAFNDDYVNVTNNSENLYSLLGGFFEYYKTFDYAQYMIAPFLGYPMPKQLFADLNTVPNDYCLYKYNVSMTNCKVMRLDTTICIQDPFDHSRNCSVGIYDKLFSRVKAHIEFAAKVFSETEQDEFLEVLFTKDTQAEVQPAFTIKHRFTNKINKKNVQVNQARKKTKERIKRWQESRRFNQKLNQRVSPW